MHPATLPVDALLRDCEETPVRRGGPGGQHRNKVETGVVLRHRPTGIIAEASERRSRAENRPVAIRRLRLALAVALRDRPEEPSALWKRRSGGGRIAVAIDHDDLPSLLAEALDRIVDLDLDMPAAAAALATSPTQLVRLLAKHPPALGEVNRRRQEKGLAALRA